MKNSIGRMLTLTLFGESHGPAVGATLDGFPAGFPVPTEAIDLALRRRSGLPDLSTDRREPDGYTFLSGIKNGMTTGTPITVILENRDIGTERDESNDIPRPGHADLTQLLAFGPSADIRGGGHSSGRLTAPLAVMGAFASSFLAQRNVSIASHVSQLADVYDASFTFSKEENARLSTSPLPVLSPDAAEKMAAAVRAAKAEKDSLGGVIETCVLGYPRGVGEPLFDSVEGVLSHLLFSIPGVKGVAFGDGFALAERRGSEANDAFVIRGRKATTETLHSGGVLGGITYGAPLAFSCVMKPTPSIGKPQHSVSLSSGTETSLTVVGRSDPTLVFRACPVVEAVTALGLADLYLCRFGYADEERNV